MSLAADKKRWDELHAALAQAEAEERAYESELGVKYGHHFEPQWLAKGQRAKLASLRAKKDKIGDKIYALVERISPRDWSSGVPSWWVRRDLTWEDAIRPKNEPLSVVVPGSYGGRDGYVKEGVQMPRKRKGQDMPARAEAAGEQYAYDQIASEYFADWVREQLLEASKMPSGDVLPLETKADALVIARNMLKQLAWDTQRELSTDEIRNMIGGSDELRLDSVKFYDGFRKACDGSRDWLADELLRIKGEMGGGGGRVEARPVDPHLWYIDLYEGETVVRTFGPYASKKEAVQVTRSRARTGLSWGDAYQGVDMGHPLKARTVNAKNKTPKHYVVEQVQDGLWVQVGHFYWKGEAERFQAKLGGRTRIKHTWPSAHNHPPVVKEGVDEVRAPKVQAAGRQATKPGKHGTLRLWKITYKDLDNPAFGEDSFRKWAYNKEHILDQFGEGREESWEIVKIEPVADTGPTRLSRATG